MFKLIANSTSDLLDSFFEEHGIDCIRFSYEIDGKEYGHGEELPVKEFYDLMRSGKMPTTSQVTPEQARAHFEKAIAEGYKEILCLAFSSGLSGSSSNMNLAARNLMEEHPDIKIDVLDTLAASMGEGLVVYKAVQLKEAGKSMAETASWIREHIQNFVHVFTVDDLFHLYRGGRVSKTTAFVGTLAGIKPKLHVDGEGHLIVIGKNRGRKKSLIALVDYMEEKLGALKIKTI